MKRKHGSLLLLLLCIWMAASVIMTASDALAVNSAAAGGTGSSTCSNGTGGGGLCNTCISDFRTGGTVTTGGVALRLSAPLLIALMKATNTPDSVDFCWLHWFSIRNVADVSFWRPVLSGGDWMPEYRRRPNASPNWPLVDHMQKIIGPVLTSIVLLAGLISIIVFCVAVFRYFRALGSATEPVGTAGRRAYESLRENISEGSATARLYACWLTGFLSAIDRFFGDSGTTNRTLISRAFGLRTPVALWTAPSFDRCLLLALLYPFATIFIIWIIFPSEPAGAAFFLKPDVSGWARGLAAAFVAVVLFATLRMRRPARWTTLILTAGAVTIPLGALLAFDNLSSQWLTNHLTPGAIGLVLCLVFFSVFAGAIIVVGNAFGGAVAVSFAVSFALAYPFSSRIQSHISEFIPDHPTVRSTAGLVILLLGPILLTTVGAALFTVLNVLAARYRWQGRFLLLFFVTMLLACIGGASLLLGGGRLFSLLLFLGFISLLVAPFVWISLGLARALLRRGLEFGGWWPFIFALANALIAAVIVPIFAFATLVAIMTFDWLAMFSNYYDDSVHVLPMAHLLDGIWIYALLLAPIIPSVIGLMIGGVALLHGLPSIPSLLLRFMPNGKAVPIFDRTWIALVLTLQVVGGVILGIATQTFLAVGMIPLIFAVV